MSAVDQSHTQLGAYALGALDPAEAADFERRHLAGCAQCRFDLGELVALRESLDEVPPEAFLEGPPDGGDMLLQRTLRQVRAEEPGHTASRSRPRRGLAIVAAAVVAMAALGGGVLVGRGTAPTPDIGAQGVAPSRNVTGENPATGAKMAASVVPFNGWVKVDVSVQGVHAGQKCELRVVSKDGQSVVAGSWQVSAKWESEGFKLDGSALVPPDQVQSVDIVTTDGQKLVSAQV
jgi:anti-sigma factor RsiW